MPARPPDLQILLVQGPPARYVARLGRGGWLEAWGWTEADALWNLAGVLVEQRPQEVPATVLETQEVAAAWLADADVTPVLDDA